jgi:hypothetical protein
VLERRSVLPTLRLVQSTPDPALAFSYVSVACRQVGGHSTCVRRRWSRCTCPCHANTASVVWRVGDRIGVTSHEGEVVLRSGNLKWARDLAETIGLKPVPGTPVGREEWVQASLEAHWHTSQHPSQHPSSSRGLGLYHE